MLATTLTNNLHVRHQEAAMGLFRWFTKNVANTQEPTHPDLAPVVVPLELTAATEVVKRAVVSLPRWRVESESAGELKATRRTRVVGFVDDVTVTLKPAGPGTMIHAASKSRLGKGDFGQNRRNILQLWDAVRSQLSTGG